LNISKLVFNGQSTMAAVAYVYFDYKDRARQTPEVVLAELIKQLAFRRTDSQANALLSPHTEKCTTKCILKACDSNVKAPVGAEKGVPETSYPTRTRTPERPISSSGSGLCFCASTHRGRPVQPQRVSWCDPTKLGVNTSGSPLAYLL
jgi:hypothetical protein